MDFFDTLILVIVILFAVAGVAVGLGVYACVSVSQGGISPNGLPSEIVFTNKVQTISNKTVNASPDGLRITDANTTPVTIIDPLYSLTTQHFSTLADSPSPRIGSIFPLGVYFADLSSGPQPATDMVGQISMVTNATTPFIVTILFGKLYQYTPAAVLISPAVEHNENYTNVYARPLSASAFEFFGTPTSSSVATGAWFYSVIGFTY